MKHYSRSNPVFAEFTIILLFFALCACILTAVFSASFTTGEKSASLEAALLEAQNIAEGYKLSDEKTADYLTRIGFEKTQNVYAFAKVFSSTEYTLSAEEITAEPFLEGFALTVSSVNGEGFTLNVRREAAK